MESIKKEIYKFSTFSGVFVPSVLAILGAVLYLITPQILGGVGLLKMLAILLIAHSITIATAFSISSIATNIHVKGGGLYYLISRSLGSEFGGSMGIQLFLAQTVAAAFYIIAFAKGLVMLLAIMGWVVPELLTASIAATVFFLLSYRGAKFIIKIQYFILAIIILSLISIIFGPNTTGHGNVLSTGLTLPFWVAFAIFFPAVTGIDAGVGMSGDLKNPKKSLVVGTFAAILFTLGVYFVIVLKLFYAADPLTLSTEQFIMADISLYAPLVLIGLLLATSSSALSCFMTAPRSLRAMVQDRIFPKMFNFLGWTIGKNPDPRIALIFSFIIALSIIQFGELHIVSQIVAMFFLNVYGWINGAAFFEKVSKNPSFRPTFNTPTMISFYGMLACYWVMYLFNPWVMFIGIAFQLLVFLVLYKTRSSVKFESVWDGVLFQLLRWVMNRIETTEKSKKNWRPTVLAVCSNELNRTPILALLDWISSNRGIMKMYFVEQGELQDNAKKREMSEKEMKHYIKEHELELYSKVIVGDDSNEVFETLLQSESIGNLPLNTVLLDYDSKYDLPRLINATIRFKKNLLILRNQRGFAEFRKLDVWWSSANNGNLMILLAFLITQSRRWKKSDAIIRLFNVVKTKKEAESTRQRLERMIDDARIDNLTTHVIIEPAKKMEDIIYEHSKFSDFVILGIPNFRNRKDDKEIMVNIKKATERLKMTLIVLANDEIDLNVN
ncbi:MAG: hypothetical protein ABIH34_08340 [Nanoarchaeota archaeon]